ncbi:hypothetical protein CLAFUW4_13158 [Fulvia fulva]|uniref:Uncharacterized protein n=1 Tax=Passalora fulva TaxID=5499 RepID=A0A9Q8PJJ4_PASFU|nr:uncharacterized protein CLAFUR5_13016 [Fulvia fulva]KAK4612080.1 hypothetical protein CLAFUR4_13163 [Fulvia fulva]KAK4613058.1 hypothetical protein CLAFUR0_13167 [Fulvia fulva]UJO23567.1 hypothetical protein CLAFUR5_13016 [Fulvia fulva]WPV21316.1 hypothetical protein CLAFUW4_13158 [Fulvia fulva]WPV36535.1 hypothetical protein CLAFUW7_13166 [Fulvia fulva]
MAASSSLSILVGDKRDSRPSDGETCQTPCRTSSETANMVETLSTTAVEGINTRSFAEAKNSGLFAPGFEAKFDDVQAATSLSEHADYLREVAKAHPEYSAKVVNVSSDVDEESGSATVYMLMSVLGRSTPIRRQAMSIVRWARHEEGNWLITSASTIRGMTASDLPGA